MVFIWLLPSEIYGIFSNYSTRLMHPKTMSHFSWFFVKKPQVVPIITRKLLSANIYKHAICTTSIAQIIEYVQEKNYLTTSENYLKLQPAHVNSMIFKILHFPESQIYLGSHGMEPRQFYNAVLSFSVITSR